MWTSPLQFLGSQNRFSWIDPNNLSTGEDVAASANGFITLQY